ncbi:MAG: polymerase sigma-70 factor, subfamily [Caulobacteraceae bacterium]|nr:polymerase sigma-70 factor, subfamily [Caulobacteraceae bacterium]
MTEAVFQAQRPRLTRLAYRMLGSLAEAEDVAQDAWLRWRRATEGAAEGEPIADPPAWLVRVTTRLCLDRLRAQRAAREAYRGPWLPEPLVEDMAEDPLERAEDVSVAFLLALQRLSPLERAVFLLHDVFEADYAAVATALGRSEAACRQLAARARSHVREARPRFEVPQDQLVRLAAAFADPPRRGDTAALTEMLAEDAVLISDGGGKRPAALRPIVGRAEVIALIEGLRARGSLAVSGEVRVARINGYPGLIVPAPDGPQTVTFEPDGAGRIAAIFIVRNPEKLSRLPQADANTFG